MSESDPATKCAERDDEMKRHKEKRNYTNHADRERDRGAGKEVKVTEEEAE